MELAFLVFVSEVFESRKATKTWRNESSSLLYFLERMILILRFFRFSFLFPTPFFQDIE